MPTSMAEVPLSKAPHCSQSDLSGEPATQPKSPIPLSLQKQHIYKKHLFLSSTDEGYR